MWFDSMAIPADAQHVDEAHEFINYMMQPEVAAANTNFVFYANGNMAAQQFIDQEILDDPGDLSGRGHLQAALHQHRLRRALAAHRHAAVDAGEDGAVT